MWNAIFFSKKEKKLQVFISLAFVYANVSSILFSLWAMEYTDEVGNSNLDSKRSYVERHLAQDTNIE